MGILYPHFPIQKKAGIFGAISFFSAEIPHINLPFTFQSPCILRNFSSTNQIPKMAENDINSPEIKEPSPKIQKLDKPQNGVLLEIPFFRVKKLSENAVLPSRASPLSAGYDLSRFVFRFYFNWTHLARSKNFSKLFVFFVYSAAEAKVPARGKALIPTDLSIAVPQGAYARIGNFLDIFEIFFPTFLSGKHFFMKLISSVWLLLVI